MRKLAQPTNNPPLALGMLLWACAPGAMPAPAPTPDKEAVVAPATTPTAASVSMVAATPTSVPEVRPAILTPASASTATEHLCYGKALDVILRGDLRSLDTHREGTAFMVTALSPNCSLLLQPGPKDEPRKALETPPGEVSAAPELGDCVGSEAILERGLTGG